LSKVSAFLAAGALLVCGCFLSGCTQENVSVAADVPQIKPAPPADLSGKNRPKGMPKNIPTNFNVDPQTGRIMPK
jgi:hypothetical protein